MDQNNNEINKLEFFYSKIEKLMPKVMSIFILFGISFTIFSMFSLYFFFDAKDIPFLDYSWPAEKAIILSASIAFILFIIMLYIYFSLMISSLKEEVIRLKSLLTKEERKFVEEKIKTSTVNFYIDKSDEDLLFMCSSLDKKEALEMIIESESSISYSLSQELIYSLTEDKEEEITEKFFEIKTTDSISKVIKLVMILTGISVIISSYYVDKNNSLVSLLEDSSYRNQKIIKDINDDIEKMKNRRECFSNEDIKKLEGYKQRLDYRNYLINRKQNSCFSGK